MSKRHSYFLLLVYVVLIVGIVGCQRETPAEKTGTQNSQPMGVAEQTVQQAVDSAKIPIDKARGVEDTLEKAAEQTADTVKEAVQ
ncbi:MAG: hypothetical protein ACREJN_18410 [Nitrospiraceae bacterium]